MRGLTLTAAMLALAAPIPAVSGPLQDDAPKVAPKKVDADKPICRRETETGSRAKIRRICMTKAQWDKVWATTRDANNALEAQGSGRIGCVRSGATGAC